MFLGPTSSLFDAASPNFGRTILYWCRGVDGAVVQQHRYQPEKLVLEINEFALYSLEQELEDLKVQNNLSVEMLCWFCFGLQY